MHNALEQFNFNRLESWTFPAFSGFVALCAFYLFHLSTTGNNFRRAKLSLASDFCCTFSFFTFSFLLQFLLFVFLEFWQHCGKAAAVQLKLFTDFCHSTPLASKVHCSINGLENSSSPEYSKVQHLLEITVGLFSVGVGLFFVTGGLGKSPPPTKKSPTPTEKSPTLTVKSPTYKKSSSNKKKSSSNEKKSYSSRKKS